MHRHIDRNNLNIKLEARQTEISHGLSGDNVFIFVLHCSVFLLAVQVFVSSSRSKVFWYQHWTFYFFPSATVLCTKDSQISSWRTMKSKAIRCRFPNLATFIVFATSKWHLVIYSLNIFHKTSIFLK